MTEERAPNRPAVRRGQLALIATCVLALSGCALLRSAGGDQAGGSTPSTEPEPSTVFPVQGGQTETTSPGALIEGRLVVRKGCIVLDSSRSGGFLTLWPSGSRFQPAPTPRVTLPYGEVVAVDGQLRQFGGGEIGPVRADGSTGLGSPANAGDADLAECRQRTGLDQVWLMAIRNPAAG